MGAGTATSTGTVGVSSRAAAQHRIVIIGGGTAGLTVAAQLARAGHAIIEPSDQHYYQSPDYPNVFALGDAGSTPNSKTGTAIRSQAPVVVANLQSVMHGHAPVKMYNGYASCPLVTVHNRMLLAEFDYDLRPAPSIPFINTQKERYDMYLLKRYGLPWMYWRVCPRSS